MRRCHRTEVITINDRKSAPRPWRTLFALLIALAGTFWVGRTLGVSNDELLGYLLASVSIVIAAGIVALLLFGVIRLFRRRG